MSETTDYDTPDEYCHAILSLGGEIPAALPVSVPGSVLPLGLGSATGLSPTDEGPGNSDCELSDSATSVSLNSENI